MSNKKRMAETAMPRKMPLPAILLIIATLLPLATFVVLVFYGKRMGNPFAGYVGTAGILLSFACSMITMFIWLQGGGMYREAGTPEPVQWGMNKGPINIPMR